MAVYRIFPEKDTFISTEVPTGNAGKDEIIEIGGYADFSGTGQTNRLLIQYSTSEIEDVVLNKINLLPYSASLCLYLADASELPVDYSIYAYLVSGAWDSGIGKFGDNPVNTSGVSWQYKKADSSAAWTTSSFAAGVTASFKPGTTPGGGTWYTELLGSNVESRQAYTLNSSNDVNLDVTAAADLIATFVGLGISSESVCPVIPDPNCIWSCPVDVNLVTNLLGTLSTANP